MQKTQLAGAVIMVGSVLQMVLFLWAVARRSYLAVALPVMGALATVSALAFWIGWTLFTAESEEEEEPLELSVEG
ncbi:MAG: hypothetical protein NZ695_08400 [Dehalococcoidia bacterium]|jgi:hypothetical protein|nr:hypothetical protein [Dehalococcoidia bacterium]MDW8008681.1 hypothetical protein [Chloroflexota bacterium]